MRNLGTLLQLLDPDGHEALQIASGIVKTDADLLRAMQVLERDYSPEVAREAAAQALLRRKAVTKFTLADRMFFTRAGLEQASGEVIARYRADRLSGFNQLFDLTAGIGGDASAFAAGMYVIAVEKDPQTMAVLQANRMALQLTESLHPVLADCTRRAWSIPGDSVLFLDPARRTSSGRVYSIHQYTPDFLPFLDFLDHTGAVVVKVSPAVKMEEIQNLAAEVEFLSVRGALKEAALWFGAPAGTARRATILPQRVSLTDQAPKRDDVSELQEYLYEPDPAVLRAGLVQHLAFILGASRIDPELGLLTSSSLQETEFARTFRVIEVIPFGLKRIRKALRARSVGKVTLKKRGSAVDTSLFEKQLNLRGDQQALVLLTKTRKGKVALLMEEIRTE